MSFNIHGEFWNVDPYHVHIAVDILAWDIQHGDAFLYSFYKYWILHFKSI